MLDPGLFFMENWGFKMQEIHKHLAVFRSFLECWGCSSEWLEDAQECSGGALLGC